MTLFADRIDFPSLARVAAATAVLTGGCTQAPSGPSPELIALMDRAAIEDFFADYYANFGASGDEDWAGHYTGDGVLDVNGVVATGADEIEAMYTRAGGDTSEPPARDPALPPQGRHHMHITNVKVDVNGDRAHASLSWFSLDADSVVGDPHVSEIGRESTDLIKQDGRWLMTRRVITSDGGMPEGLLDGYEVR